MTAGRSILMALVAGVFLWLASGLAADKAVAQCGTCGTPPPACNTCGTPPPPPPSCDTCGGGRPGHHVYVPGVNVNVAASVVVNANVNAQAGANAAASAQSGSRAYSSGSAFSGVLGLGAGYGGGGQSFFTPPMATGYIQGLTVESPERRQRVAYEASRSAMRRVVIQSFCLDDRDIPHPASQVTPDREIGDYEGEIFRCIAGSRLQYVIAEYRGEASQVSCGPSMGGASGAGGPAGLAGGACSGLFNGGQTVVCNKSDALYYAPNGQGGGALSCRPQKPARDCNERSLLRRFGAGVKILTMVTTERYTAYREEVVREQAVSGQMYGLSLDGGVGGVAF